MTEYNATITYRARNVEQDDAADELLDALIAYHPALGIDEFGHLEAIITFPADGLRQVVTTAQAVAERATIWPGLGVQVIPTDIIFDARAGLAPPARDRRRPRSRPDPRRQRTGHPPAPRLRLPHRPLRSAGRDWRIPRTALHLPKRAGADDVRP